MLQIFQNSSKQDVTVDLTDAKIDIQGQKNLLDRNISSVLGGRLIMSPVVQLIIKDSPGDQKTQTFMGNMTQFISSAEHLKEVDFSGNNFGEKIGEHNTIFHMNRSLSKCTVEALNLSNNNLTAAESKDSLVAIIQKMPGLKRLDLSHNPKLNDNFGLIGFFENSNLTDYPLEELNLKNCNLDGMTTAIIAQSKAFAVSLNRLNIANNLKLTLADINNVIYMLPNLRKLDITGCNLAGDDKNRQDFLASIKKRPGLEIIYDISALIKPIASVKPDNNNQNPPAPSVNNNNVIVSNLQNANDEIAASLLTMEKEPIAGGGFGVVYLATYQQNKVVVKLPAENVVLSVPETLRPKALSDFLYEAEVLKGMGPHENIVKYFGTVAVKTRGFTGIVLEYLDGGSLFNYICKNKDNPNWGERYSITTHILKGLAFLHTKYIHGDLKSLNIMLSYNGEGLLAKIIDMGGARKQELNTLTQKLQTLQTNNTKGYVGTFRWQGPEQFPPKIIKRRGASPTSTSSTGQTPDANTRSSRPADIYSLGVIVGELLTSEIPFAEFDDQSSLRDFYNEQWTDGLPTEDMPVLLPENPKNFTNDYVKLKDVMFLCLFKNPDNRATAAVLSEKCEPPKKPVLPKTIPLFDEDFTVQAIEVSSLIK